MKKKTKNKLKQTENQKTKKRHKKQTKQNNNKTKNKKQTKTKNKKQKKAISAPKAPFHVKKRNGQAPGPWKSNYQSVSLSQNRARKVVANDAWF